MTQKPIRAGAAEEEPFGSLPSKQAADLERLRSSIAKLQSLVAAIDAQEGGSGQRAVRPGTNGD